MCEMNSLNILFATSKLFVEWNITCLICHIVTNPNQFFIYSNLHRIIRASKYVHGVESIPKCKVPIVKFTHTSTRIPVDISYTSGMLNYLFSDKITIQLSAYLSP